jgi:hypothetical protein
VGQRAANSGSPINEPSDESEYELDAFQRGFVFWESPKADYMPPIDDIGRREWLEEFCQAHADCPDTLDPEEGETAQEALDRLLRGHPALPTLKRC